MNINFIKQKKPISTFNIALVISRFNEAITEKLHAGALERLHELDFSEDQINSIWVPGAVEIPVTAQTLASSNTYAAIVCLGAVIRGETTHYDYVCQQVSYGCQRVALDQRIPVVFGVLTTENSEQAFDRLGGVHGHKGKESIDTAVEMVELFGELHR